MARWFMSGLIGFPDASTPCNRAVHCGPAARNVRVCLWGGGSGLNVDFARLSSHVPTRSSPCAQATEAWVSTSTTGIVQARETLTAFITIPPRGPSEEEARKTLYLISAESAIKMVAGGLGTARGE